MTLFTAEGLLLADSAALDDRVESIRRSYLAWLLTQDPSASDRRSARAGCRNSTFLHYATRARQHVLVRASGRRHRNPRGPHQLEQGLRRHHAGAHRRARSPSDWFELGARAAALTHGHPSGYLSAGVFAHVVGELMRGAPLLDAIESARAALSTWPEHEETSAAIDASGARSPQTGDVDAEADRDARRRLGRRGGARDRACAARSSRPTCAPGSLLAVNHSGDSDSTGSIAGNLLGAMHGLDALPRTSSTTRRSRRHRADRPRARRCMSHPSP